MAATTTLTLEQYRAKYASEAGWEYWFGEAVKKPVPTWIHGVLQLLLGEILFRAGYFTSSETDLRVDPDWEPRPDVAATLNPPEGPYATRPVEVAIEILSTDQMTQLLDKCQNYARIGVAQVFVFDADKRRIWKWSSERDDLERIADLTLTNGTTVTGESIWQEFERRIQRRKPQDPC